MQKTICPKCRKEKIKKFGSHNRITNEEFIKRALKVHGDTYDYSKTIYNGMHKPIIVICKEHGEFTQSKAIRTSINKINCFILCESQFNKYTIICPISYYENMKSRLVSLAELIN